MISRSFSGIFGFSTGIFGFGAGIFGICGSVFCRVSGFVFFFRIFFIFRFFCAGEGDILFALGTGDFGRFSLLFSLCVFSGLTFFVLLVFFGFFLGFFLFLLVFLFVEFHFFAAVRALDRSGFGLFFIRFFGGVDRQQQSAHQQDKEKFTYKFHFFFPLIYCWIWQLN